MPSTTVREHKITYNVTAVTVNGDGTVTGYRGTADRDHLLTGLRNRANWTANFDLDTRAHKVTRVTGLGFPVVDGHPGHVHGSGSWKYQVERGTTRSVDRLVLENWTGTIRNQTTAVLNQQTHLHELTLDLDNTCSARIIQDTHG